MNANKSCSCPLPTTPLSCSAGCGRTGVICAIDYTWTLVKDGVSVSLWNLWRTVCSDFPCGPWQWISYWCYLNFCAMKNVVSPILLLKKGKLLPVACVRVWEEWLISQASCRNPKYQWWEEWALSRGSEWLGLGYRFLNNNFFFFFTFPKILPMNFSIFSLIQEMRTQRPLIVQTQVCSENSHCWYPNWKF